MGRLRDDSKTDKDLPPLPRRRLPLRHLPRPPPLPRRRPRTLRHPSNVMQVSNCESIISRSKERVGSGCTKGIVQSSSLNGNRQ